MTAGYPGTPLAKKLSLKDGISLFEDGMPHSVRSEILASCTDVHFVSTAEPPIEAAHIFITRREDLERKLVDLLPLLAPGGFIWVSWPKKAAKVETDVTEDVIREVALPRGLVDVKVCAVDQIWSGLKLVIRKENRS